MPFLFDFFSFIACVFLNQQTNKQTFIHPFLNVFINTNFSLLIFIIT